MSAPDAPYLHHVRTGYGDTDQSGVIHHAVYLRWLEDARVGWLRERGADFADASYETIETCLKWFIEHSERFQNHRKKFADKLDVVTERVEVTGPEPAQAAG